MNLPSDFISYTRQLMGNELYSRLEEGLDSQESPVSIRLNPFKAQSLDVTEGLYDCTVPWCRLTGRYLRERPNFTFDPLLHSGLYYVQEAASMIVDHIVRTFIKEPVRMLDLCAAPGGKSTALRAALPEGSVLFSNEPMRTRAQILSENLQKFGHEDVIVTNNYPRDYRKAGIMFDAILADVPCSGEGMFRKDDGARAEWSQQNVDNCWQLQREIVSDIWKCLQPGGLLIYSTCTFNAYEDEENVEWIASELGADIIELPVKESWDITPAVVGNVPVCRFLPGISRSEGLFVAVLRKHGESETTALKASAANSKPKKDRKNQRKQTAQGGKQQSADTMQALRTPDNFTARRNGDEIVAIPKRWADTYDAAASTLKIMHAGVTLGTEKGRDIIPDQSLALSRQLNIDAYPQVELSYAEAINFLRKEAVTLPEGTPRGFVVVTYLGYPLGMEKNIGNRANNLYPTEWRIKSTHVPKSECHVLA